MSKSQVCYSLNCNPKLNSARKQEKPSSVAAEMLVLSAPLCYVHTPQIIQPSFLPSPLSHTLPETWANTTRGLLIRSTSSEDVNSMGKIRSSPGCFYFTVTLGKQKTIDQENSGVKAEGLLVSCPRLSRCDRAEGHKVTAQNPEALSQGVMLVHFQKPTHTFFFLWSWLHSL